MSKWADQTFGLGRLSRYLGVMAGIGVLVAGAAWAAPPTVTVKNAATRRQDMAVAGQVVVRFSPAARASVRQAAHLAVGGKVLATLPQLGWQLVACPAGQSIENTVAAYSRQPGVKGAAPNYVYKAFGKRSVGTAGLGPRLTPNDPRYGELYGMTNIQAPLAWDLQTGDANVVIAVCDTGIDRSHADLAANTWVNTDETPGDGDDDDGNGFVDDRFGWDFADDDNDPDADDGTGNGKDHGTHCAGTIGAVGNNAVGVVGVNWTCRLMSVRVLDSSGGGSYFGVASGITYAADSGAHVISLSLGGGYDPGMQDAIDYAYGLGSVICCALGNEYSEITSDPSTWVSPVCNDGVLGADNKILGVAAVDQNDAKADFSNYSNYQSFCDVAAPGVNVLSTIWPAGYARYSGTSMATPHVAGLVGLLKAHFPTATNAQIMARIRALADNVDAQNPGLEGKLGTGRINAYRALGPTVPGPATLVSKLVDDDTNGGSNGDGSGTIDPGETVELTLGLRNQGVQDLTGVQGTLSTAAAGVTVTTATRSYGTLPGGAVGTGAGPFVCSVGAGVPNDSDIAFRLEVTAGNGGPYTLDFTLHVGRDQWGEPDNTPATAAQAPTDGTLLARRLEVGGDQDWFRFTAVPGTEYRIQTSDLGDLRGSRATTGLTKGDIGARYADTVLELYDTDGSTILDWDDDGGGSLASLILWTASTAGDYYVRCVGYSSATTGIYSLGITGQTASPGPLALSGWQVDDSAGNGDGTVDPGETVELTVALGNGGRATATDVKGLLSTTEPGLTVLEDSADFGDIAAGSSASSLTAFRLQVAAGVAEGTDLQCSLRATAGNCGPYDFTLTLHVGRDAWGEPDNQYTQALPIITDGTEIDRRLEMNGDHDWFSFPCVNGAVYEMRTLNLGDLAGRRAPVGTAKAQSEVGPLYADTVLELYGTDGVTRLAYNDDDGTSLASYIRWTCPASGTYFLMCRGYAEARTGVYSLSVSGASGLLETFMPEADAVNVPRNTPVGMTFTWPVNQASAESHVTVTQVGGTVVTGTFDWWIPNRKLRFHPDVPLERNTQYHVAVAAGIERTTGQVINDSAAWSFTTGGGPAVTQALPQGDTPGARPTLRVTFDEPMHRVSVQNSFALVPDLPGVFSWSGNTFIFTPTADVTPHTDYLVTIGARARSVTGVALGRAYEWSFHAVGSMLVTNMPLAGATNVARNTPIGMTFAWPVDEASAQSQVSVYRTDTPGSPLAGTFEWLIANQKLRFYPATPLDPGANYTVALAAGIQRQDGSTIDWAESWRFTTTAGPAITAWAPKGTGVGPKATVRVTFDQNMHRLSVQNNFRIVPATAGGFQWVGRRLTFTPSDSLSPGTLYRVTIKAACRNAAGVRLGRDFIWTFTTAGAASPALALSAVAVPTASGAQISVNLSAAAEVQVTVLNLAGRTIAVLPAQNLAAGLHSLAWSGRSSLGLTAPGGTYLVRVAARAADGAQTQALTSLAVRR